MSNIKIFLVGMDNISINDFFNSLKIGELFNYRTTLYSFEDIVKIAKMQHVKVKYCQRDSDEYYKHGPFTVKVIENCFSFGKFHISSHMISELERYIEHGILPHEFCSFVICNDLFNACKYATSIQLENIPAFVKYLYEKAPIESYGSYPKMKAWMLRKQLE